MPSPHSHVLPPPDPGTLSARLRGLIPDPRSAAAQVLLGVVLAAVAVVAGRALLAKPLFAVGGIVVAALAVMVVRAPRAALFSVLAGFILMEEFDLSSTQAFFEGGVDATLLGLRILGVSVMDFLLLLFLVPVLLKEWYDRRHAGIHRHFAMDRHFIPILVVYAFGAVNGWFHKLGFSHFTWEARDIVYIIGWYIITSRLLTDRRDVQRMVGIVMVMLSLKSLLFIYRIATAQGLFYGYDFHRFALGSDIPLMAPPLVCSVAAYLLFRDARRWMRFAALASIAFWSVLLISALGRSTYILTAVALVVILVMLRRHVTTGMVLRAVGMGLAGGVVFYFAVLTETQRELISYALGSAFNWVGALTLSGDLSIGQRVLEIMNIGETLTRAGAWVWGLGWGAPWSEIVMHHPFDKGSFPIEEQLAGVHTTAHLDFVYFVLKVGVAGTIVIYWGLMRFVREAAHLVRTEQERMAKLALIGILVFLIVTVPNYIYFVKLKCLMGMAFGAIAHLTAHPRAEEAGT